MKCAFGTTKLPFGQTELTFQVCCYKINSGDIMKKEKRTKEKWIHMNNKMNKILIIFGVIGIVLVAISLIAAFLGFLMSSENLFYTGISLLVFVLPACFVVFLLVFIIAVIIEEKSK